MQLSRTIAKLGKSSAKEKKKQGVFVGAVMKASKGKTDGKRLAILNQLNG